MDHQHSSDFQMSPGPTDASALDPVCGMTVDKATAGAKGLHVEYQGVDYFFCSKGCKLDFDEDPARYLDPSYTAAM